MYLKNLPPKYYYYFWLGIVFAGIILVPAILNFHQFAFTFTKDNPQLSESERLAMAAFIVVWSIPCAIFFPQAKYLYDNIINSLFSSRTEITTPEGVVVITVRHTFFLWSWVGAFIWFMVRLYLIMVMWAVVFVFAPILGPIQLWYAKAHHPVASQ